MRLKEINQRFTEIVADFISKGYIINTTTMNGSQGEISKIDLTDGVEIIRVVVDTFSDWRNDIEGVSITVGRAWGAGKPHTSDGVTIWSNKLEILHVEQFYKIGESRKSGNYYGTEKEAKAATAVRHKRYGYRKRWREVEDFTDKAMEIAKKVISREFGYKKIAEKEIDVKKIDGKYIVSYRGKVYRLK